MHIFPAELRRIILAEHDQLRAEVDALTALLPRASDARVADELRQRVQGFSTRLLAHMDHEERVLRPLLADEAWGQQRVSVMDADHAAQRARVAEISQRVSGPASEWSGAVARFLAAVRADMVSEEKEALV